MRPTDPPLPRVALTPRLRGFGTTVFAEMSALAAEHGAINLGQGFPDSDGPTVVKEAAVAAIRAGHNQYPPGPGIPELRAAIAEHQRRFYGIELDPGSEVLVTTGATEAVAAGILAFTGPGDEVIALEPFYDSYAACVAMSGATLVPLTLRPPHFTADEATLRACVTPRTRLILLNSPHNPTGVVLSPAELRGIAEVAVEHDLIVLADEVYEHLVYDGTHIPISTLPGMRDRTVTVSSAAKTFALTGWKIGWATGPADLVGAVRTAKQYLTFVSGAPFQPAIAAALRLEDGYYTGLRQDLRRRRDILADGLTSVGFEVYRPAGTYFVTADVRPLGFEDGYAFCRRLPEWCGVAAVPNAVFYADPREGRALVRFAFCKRPDVLREAIRRLASMSRPS
ncbi:pyridoxal phosphate-dependent aminotransferase [Dactylosporangium sp. NPDC049525]|uniref:pyridoxal phosphate-dependent aminotransferase n=1 Tax=Dactylosporangium sp. NPDC049525 TaxID=3154730 RepID=UPI003419A239